MRKRPIIIISTFIGLIIASLSIEFAFQYLVGHNQWFGLMIGVGFMMLGFISIYLGSKFWPFLILAYILNMIGVGLSITAYYVLKSFPLDRVDYMVAIGVSLAMLIGFALFSSIPFIRRHNKLWLVIVIVLSFVMSLILWLTVDSFTGLSFYYLNVTYFFFISVIESVDSHKKIFKELAINSAGAFILISLIVLIILSEGEVAGGLDVMEFGGSRKKKRG